MLRQLTTVCIDDFFSHVDNHVDNDGRYGDRANE